MLISLICRTICKTSVDFLWACSSLSAEEAEVGVEDLEDLLEEIEKNLFENMCWLWACSSVGESTVLIKQGSWVQVPAGPPLLLTQK